jgi:hypothetical protein
VTGARCRRLFDLSSATLSRLLAGIGDYIPTGLASFWLSALLMYSDGLGTMCPYAVEMAEHLITGDRLPPLYGTDLEGNEVDVTASVAGRWAVVLFYRGDW